MKSKLLSYLIAACFFTIVSKTQEASATTNYGLSFGQHLTTNFGYIDETTYYNDIELRSIFGLNEWLNLEANAKYLRWGSIGIYEDYSTINSQKIITLGVVPKFTWNQNRWSYFLGFSLDWQILLENQNYSNQTSGTSPIDSSIWFNNQWSGFKPDFGWVIGGSYDISEFAEFDFRLKNTGEAWGSATVLMLGFNTRY